ncbi:hypothetical protein [Caldivirga sp.]|uniref:hypothetical protein n=1 Tax=Caldivirga sp. TaxID=2080243 RepID=UPI0025BE34D3|nr:hypothetical protein [Caldivirga sp.]
MPKRDLRYLTIMGASLTLLIIAAALGTYYILMLMATNKVALYVISLPIALLGAYSLYRHLKRRCRVE